MSDANQMTVRILKRDTESLQQSKDEEYAYWQSRPPAERLAAMLELKTWRTFRLFEELRSKNRRANRFVET